jgi:acetyl esterase/lipase
MSQKAPRHEMTTRTVVYRIPGMGAVTVRPDVVYHAPDTGALTMDLYYPPDAKARAPLPAVVFVIGYSDLGAEAVFGCKFKEMESYIGWARLAAASGLVGITYTNRDPEPDLYTLLRYVRHHAAELGLDETRIAVWSCSGNVPLALAALMQPEFREHLKCAALCYGFTLDLDGSTLVADAQKQWRFANPGAGKSVRDLPPDLPLFIARAGQDHNPGLNETMDRFVSQALACNLPITVANHPTGPHAFDMLQDSETSREIIRQILAFLRFHLQAQ